MLHRKITVEPLMSSQSFHRTPLDLNQYSETCIKRPPLGVTKYGLLRQGAAYHRAGMVILVSSGMLNPLSAIDAIWRHIIVSLQVLPQKSFIGICIF